MAQAGRPYRGEVSGRELLGSKTLLNTVVSCRAKRKAQSAKRTWLLEFEAGEEFFLPLYDIHSGIRSSFDDQISDVDS